MQNEIIDLMINEFRNSKKRNSSYSLRAYASRLGIAVSALSELMNHKRPLTEKMALKILNGLGHSDDFANQLIKSKDYDRSLSINAFQVISDWYYFAILSLAEIEDFSIDKKWISQRLNISTKQAADAVVKLRSLEMLVQREDGQWIASGLQFKVPGEISSSAVKNHTDQSLELARESLYRDQLEKRDFSTITMAIDPDKLPEAKRIIKSFKKKISKVLETGKKREVYKLAVQLFPLSLENKNLEEL
jgi:uncharacterized protein (TIGR02147 family)